MVDVKNRSGVLLLKVTGNLDITPAKEMEEIINHHIANGEKLFVIDLGDVQYLSSSGIRVFVATLRQLNKIKGRLVLSNLSETAVKTLRIVEMTGIFDIIHSVEDALKALKPE